MNLQALVDGLMLGDGSLRANGPTKALLILANKSTDLVDWVGEQLSSAGIQFRRRTEHGRYARIETLATEYLGEQRRRWYPAGKTIPHDLVLTPLTVLLWYVGDGSLRKVRYKDWITYGAHLHTECFIHEDQERLVGLLRDAGIVATVKTRFNGTKEYEHLSIGAEHYQQLFDYMGACPFPDLAYKWPAPHPERPLLTARQEEALTLRRQGLGIRKVAEQMKVTPAAAWYILEQLRAKLPDEPCLKNMKNGKARKKQGPTP